MSNILTPARRRSFPVRPPLGEHEFIVVPYDGLGGAIITTNKSTITLPWVRREGNSYTMVPKVLDWTVTITVACEGSGKCHGVRIVDEEGNVAFTHEFPNWCAYGPTILDIEFTFSVVNP